MQRIKLTISYTGTSFSGWQAQEHKHLKHPRTVQSELEKAVKAVTGTATRVHGSGRTDAGVHAEMQVAHFDAPLKLAAINWPAALQRQLPEDISIIAAEPVSTDFHARFSAQGKIYVYSLWLHPHIVPARIKPFAWPVQPLGFELLDAACKLFTGTHNFEAFQNSGTDVKDSTRTIWHIKRYPLPLPLQALTPTNATVASINTSTPSTLPPVTGSTALPTAVTGTPNSNLPLHPYWALEFYGNGFLKQMVRNLTGCLVAAAYGKVSLEQIESLLQGHTTRASIPFTTAPACGLTLKEVLY